MKRNHPIAITLGAILLLPMASFAQAAPETSGSHTKAQAAPEIPAAERATREQLARLFQVMRIRDQVQSMRGMISSSIEGQLKDQMQSVIAQNGSDSQLTPDQRQQLDQLMRKYMDKAVNLYPVSEMLDDMTGLYQRHLSRQDVDAMIAFYGSPAGKHLLDAQPKIAREYMPLVMSRMAERSKELTAEMMKDVAALKESSDKAQPDNKK